MLYKSTSHYRPASKLGATREDKLCINEGAAVYAVCDGVSGPHSPSNPQIMYGEMTGGQMVGVTVNYVLGNAGISPKQTIQNILGLANRIVGLWHINQEKNLNEEAVAGACVAACQIKKGSVTLILIGDCFAFWRDGQGFHSLTNFDQAACDFEERGNETFQACKIQAQKTGQHPWDLYYPHFCKKQFFRANRNLGSGGHAMLNGDIALPDCWTLREIPLKDDLQWILLCTDGLLPPHLTLPAQHCPLQDGIGKTYEQGGVYAIEHWRDDLVTKHEAETKGSSMPHIDGTPEGSVIAINFYR